MDLIEVRHAGEDRLVAERHIDEAVVGEGAHGRNRRGLLATAGCAGRHEQAAVLAPVATGGPLTAGLVPESLPLSREVSVPSRNTKEDCIILGELGRLDNRVGGLGRSVHLGKHLVRQSLSDPGG